MTKTVGGTLAGKSSHVCGVNVAQQRKRGVQRILSSFLVAFIQGLHGGRSVCRADRIVPFVQEKEYVSGTFHIRVSLVYTHVC